MSVCRTAYISWIQPARETRPHCHVVAKTTRLAAPTNTDSPSGAPYGWGDKLQGEGTSPGRDLLEVGTAV